MARLALLITILLWAASGCFAQAVPVTPQEPPAPLSDAQQMERKGDVQMARKLYREAVETYRQLLKLQPNNAVIWNKLGIAYHQQLQFNQARKHYERAVKLRRDYSEAINNIGTIYYAQKNYKKAIRMYQKALEFAPNSASIYSNLGTGWFARKKYDEAFAAYRKALELDPDVFEHRSSYGVLLQERSVEDRARFHFFLARAYASSKNFERAVDYLRKALEEGFNETKKLYEDEAFAELVKTAQFNELMANPPTPLPR